MVRFSDIIKTKGKKGETGKPPEPAKQGKGFRLSDSWFFKSRNLDTLSPKKVLRRASSFEAESFYHSFVDRARETGQWVKNDMQISPSPILSDLHAVVEKDLIDSLYKYVMSVKNEAEDIFTHTVDVTFTSLKIGKGMNYDIKMMLKLGLAAFLENVGMYKIPEDILSVKGKLSESDLTLIRKHPETSYDLLMTLGDRYTWLAEAALSTHERADGSGYPSGLKEAEIPELSAVIGLADIYCAMIRNRPYRDKFMQTDAVNSIIQADRWKFPSKVLKIFLNQISLFPVNSWVKLNNGQIGRVLFTDRRHPLSPVIEILYNDKQEKLDERKEISLTDDPLLYIEGWIDPDELVQEGGPID